MRKALAALSCGLVLSVWSNSGLPVRAAQGPSVVAACANPALPGEILSKAPAPGPAALEIVDVTGASKALRLAVAADAPTRELGLMCVTGLQPQHGMIFVFPQTSEQPFWMKNTLISLDMVWVDGSGVVTSVAAEVPASTRRTTDPDVARRTGRGHFVIELAAGEAHDDGLTAGVRLTIPALHASP